jgi:nicotinamide phosphoribosyltransferase
MASWPDNIILLSDSYKVSHWRQYPPGTEYVYSYFESRGCERDGWDEVCFFGLQYFIKRYLTGQVVTREKIEQASKLYAQHFGDGKKDDNDMFYREGWEYILERHGGRLPVKIKAVPEGMVVPNKAVLITVVNTDINCFWLTNFLETLLVQVWYPMTVCTNSRMQKLSIQKYLEETGCTDWKIPGGAAYKLHDFGFRGVSSVESAALGGLGHLVNFLGSDTVVALVAAQQYYGAKRAIGFSIPASEHSTITSWGTEGECDAMRNMLEQYPQGVVACVSDSFDVFRACRDYWGDALKDLIKGRICEAEGRWGQLVVRPDSGDPEETCVSIMKILLEQFKADVTETLTGHKLLPPYIRIIQGDGVDYITIPKILQRFKEEGIAAANITFGSGGSLLQKVNRDTFKVAFKCSEITINGEQREVFKDPITDNGKASKKGRLTLQHASDITTYAPEDIYVPRQGADGVKGGTGYLHFTPDGKFVTVASGKGDPEKDLLVDIFEDGDLVQEWSFGDIRRRADLPNGPFSQGDLLDEEEEVETVKESQEATQENGAKHDDLKETLPEPTILAASEPIQVVNTITVTRSLGTAAASPVPVLSNIHSVAAPVPSPYAFSPSSASPGGTLRTAPAGVIYAAPGVQVMPKAPSFVAAPPQGVVSSKGVPSFVAAPPQGVPIYKTPQQLQPYPSQVFQRQPSQPFQFAPKAGVPVPQPLYFPSQSFQSVGRPSFVAAPQAMSARPSFVAAPPQVLQGQPVFSSAHFPSTVQAPVRSAAYPISQAMPQRSASVGVGFGLAGGARAA